MHLDVGEILEKAFWDMSVNSLNNLRGRIDSGEFGSSFVVKSVARDIDRVISQREFMKRNKELRYSLLPE